MIERIEPGTKVLWETRSPNGPCYPDVLHEGRVVDPAAIWTEHQPGFAYVTENPNAVLHRSECVLVSIRNLVW